MKLQATLTYGLALALFSAGASFAAPPVPAAQPTPTAPYYGQPAAPAQAAASQRYAYPAAAAPAAAQATATQQPVYNPYAANQYAANPYAAQPQLTYGQQPVAAVPQAPAVGVGGYPVAPVRVAQTLPTPGAVEHSAVEQGHAHVTPAPPVEAHAAPAGHAPVTHAPAAQSWTGYTAPPTSDCATGNCNTAAPAMTAAPCDTGACGGMAYESTGYANCGSGGCDLSAGCGTAGPSRQWFFGLYGLYMDRDNPGRAITAVEVATPPGAGTTYYPQAGVDRFLSSSDVDPDFRGGAEIRFGSTLGSAYDPCTCSCYQPFAWEVGYWAITDDPDQAVIIEDIVDADRIYGMRNYAGLEYDRPGTGAYRPVNDYYDYQDPVDGDSTNDIRVLGVRVRQNFEAQNLELNLWRFGAPSGGVAVAGNSCGLGNGLLGRGAGCGASACGTGACGSSCGYDTCGSSCGTCAAPQRFFISGLAGFRYFRTDETFQNAVSFTNTTIGTDPTVYPGGFPEDDERALFDETEIDNELVGFQLGCSLNRLMGCKWTLFCDSNFGVYNNNMEKYQRVFGGGGPVRFIGTGGDAVVRSSKNDIAFLGEARCGVAYQVSCRARLTAAWRVIAASGIATAVGQNTDWSAPELASYIDSNDSLILHGLQAGVEFKY